MDNEFIYPNWHVILIHYPLGLLTVGVVIEILSFFWRRSTVRLAGRWMILIGALASIPSLTLGLYAFRDVVTPAPIDDMMTWRQVTQHSHWSEHTWEHMESHLWYEAGATALAVFAAIVWLACSDNGRRRFYWPALILLVIALGVMSTGAWYSGEAVYRHGVAIAPLTSHTAATEGHRAEPAEMTGTHPAATLPATPDALVNDLERASTTLENQHESKPGKIEHYIPPLQLHVLLAGITIAIALGAMGITMRRWAMLRTAVVVAVVPEGVKAVEVPDYRLRPEAGTRPPSTDPRPGSAALPPVYPARVWLWTLVLAIGTALSGLWFTQDWQVKALRQGFTNEFALDRLFGHVLVGSSIVLLLLFGAILTRLAPRHRFLTVLIMLLLIVAVAGQMWLGILLLFDSTTGPVTGFNPA